MKAADGYAKLLEMDWHFEDAEKSLSTNPFSLCSQHPNPTQVPICAPCPRTPQDPWCPRNADCQVSGGGVVSSSGRSHVVGSHRKFLRARPSSFRKPELEVTHHQPSLPFLIAKGGQNQPCRSRRG